MAWSPNGNVLLFVYREDLLKAAGIAPPKTWEDVLASCAKLSNPPSMYGMVMRGERGNGIRFDWMYFMIGKGATVVKDPAAGDYTVTINSPQAKAALDLYLDVAKRCGPPNAGALGQGDLIQLHLDRQGRAGDGGVGGMVQLRRSDQVRGGRQDRRGADPAAGRRQVAGDARQLEHGDPEEHPRRAEEGGARVLALVPDRGCAARVRRGRRDSRTRGRVPVGPRAESRSTAGCPRISRRRRCASQELGYAEGAQVEQILGLRLNQALIGEMSSGKALNPAAKEIEEMFRKSGRRTGALPPLPE